MVNRNHMIITLLVVVVALLIGYFGLLWTPHHFDLKNVRNLSKLDNLKNFQLIEEFKKVYVTPHEELFQTLQEVLIQDIAPTLLKYLSEDQKQNIYPPKWKFDTSPVLCETNYMQLRNQRLTRLEPPHSLLDFVDDKLQTKKCLENEAEGIVFTEIICEILVEMETPADFKGVWDNKIFPNLNACVNTYFENNPNTKRLFMKPNHLSYSQSGITITQSHFLEEPREKFLERFVSRGYFLDKQSYETKKTGASWMRATPGIIVQPVVPTKSEELRFYTIFGRAEMLQFGGTCLPEKNFRVRGATPPVIAQFHRTSENIWEPSILPDSFEEWRKKDFNKMQENCLKYLNTIKNFTNIVKKVDLLGSILHMDLVRIDAFPVEKEEQVWFNELEIDAAIQIINYKDYILKELEHGYEKNKKNEFIKAEDAKKKFNEHCFDSRETFKPEKTIEKIEMTAKKIEDENNPETNIDNKIIDL